MNPTKVYDSQIQGFVVMGDESGKLWMVPPVLNGWDKRTPYNAPLGYLKVIGTEWLDNYRAAGVIR